MLPHLLKLIRHDPVNLGEDIMELLALLGYQMPVSGHGIRILSLDGGGVRSFFLFFVFIFLVLCLAILNY